MMTENPVSIYLKLQKSIEAVLDFPIREERKPIVDQLIDYIQNKLSENQEIQLIFICTHNSRRSQFAQVWAQTAAAYFEIPASCYSGGVEETACNPRTIASLKRSGFKVIGDEQHVENPIYRVFYSDKAEALTLFSKIYDDPVNPQQSFAAVMTCSDADQNCPFVLGAEARIALKYDDPKEFDNTPFEASKYDERSLQIAGEIFYIFSHLTNQP